MKSLIGIFVMFLCANSFAGSQTGKVQTILVREDGLHYVILEGVPVGKPACATIGYWMIRDENSAAGKSQLSVLLAAQVSGRVVHVEGRNTCTRWDDGEDISSVQVTVQ